MDNYLALYPREVMTNSGYDFKMIKTVFGNSVQDVSALVMSSQMLSLNIFYFPANPYHCITNMHTISSFDPYFDYNAYI